MVLYGGFETYNILRKFWSPGYFRAF